MVSEKMDNIAGPPVEGVNFFGREQVVGALLDQLWQHDVLLLGPRRIGKTSLARRVLGMAKREGWRVVEVNVASCQDELGFLAKLQTGLEAELAPKYSAIKSAVSKIADTLPLPDKLKIKAPEGGSVEVALGERAAEDWIKSAGSIIKRLGQLTVPLMVYVDELPIFLFNLIQNDQADGVRRVRRFLDWFRNDLCNLASSRPTRWLITGSIGLDSLVQQHQMADTINHVKHQTLEPFSPAEATGLLQTLAASYGLALNEAETMAAVTALHWPQPYYLQLFFNEWRTLDAPSCGGNAEAWAEQIVERMIAASANNDFHHWEERLGMQLSPTDAAHARLLLTRSSADPQGGRAESLLALLHEQLPGASAEEARQTFSRLRDILVRDAYWLADDSSGARRYHFRLEPLRRWWIRRNSL